MRAFEKGLPPPCPSSILPTAPCSRSQARRPNISCRTSSPPTLPGMGTGPVGGGGRAPPPARFLTPQGKIMFDFLIAREGAETFLIDVRADIVADLQKRLMLYKLRAKVDISVQEQGAVSVSWEDDSAASRDDSTARRDMRFVELPVMRAWGGQGCDDGHNRRVGTSCAFATAWLKAGRITNSPTPSRTMCSSTRMAGWACAKGCYVGQEVVSPHAAPRHGGGGAC